MSFDLAGKTGRLKATAAITSAAGLVSSNFDATLRGSAGVFLVKVDTTAGAVHLAELPKPSTLWAGVKDSDVFIFMKSSTDTNTVTYQDSVASNGVLTGTGGSVRTNDGWTGLDLSYINQKGESITLSPNLTADTWTMIV